MSLRLTDVRKGFRTRSGPREVLRDVNFSVANGESVAIVGESGVGKSTLIGLIAGYSVPDAGSITRSGHEVTGPGPDRVVVSQQDALFPWLRVHENARYAGLVGHYRRQRKEIEARADALLKRFGIWEHRRKFPSALSGGERRRVELVRAFAVQSEILLLDEPYTSLDEGLRVEFGQYLLEWRRESPEVCTVLVTHDLEEACFLADRVLVLGGQPASILAEEWVGFGPERTNSLRLSPEYQEVVLRVRRSYHDARSTRPVVQI